MAARHIRNFYVNEINLVEALREAPKANIRFYFKPHDYYCPDTWQFDFNGEDTWCYQEEGRKNAQQALSLGQEKIGLAVREWAADEALQKKYRYVYDYVKEKYNL